MYLGEWLIGCFLRLRGVEWTRILHHVIYDVPRFQGSILTVYVTLIGTQRKPWSMCFLSQSVRKLNFERYG
jgi:hypothetical protein